MAEIGAPLSGAFRRHGYRREKLFSAAERLRCCDNSSTEATIFEGPRRRVSREASFHAGDMVGDLAGSPPRPEMQHWC